MVSGHIRHRRAAKRLAGLLAAACVTACSQEPHARLHTPPQGPPDNPSMYQPALSAMTDNALLSQMSLGEIHFVPGQADLSGLGAMRLKRMGELMAEHRGVIHYNARITDEDLIAARIENVEQFLAMNAPDTTSFEVRLGMPGGRGVDAPTAVVRHYRGEIGYGEREEELQRVQSDTGGGGAGGTTVSGGGAGR